jgi:hypothetical protein
MQPGSRRHTHTRSTAPAAQTLAHTHVDIEVGLLGVGQNYTTRMRPSLLRLRINAEGQSRRPFRARPHWPPQPDAAPGKLFTAATADSLRLPLSGSYFSVSLAEDPGSILGRGVILERFMAHHGQQFEHAPQLASPQTNDLARGWTIGAAAFCGHHQAPTSLPQEFATSALLQSMYRQDH